MDRYDFIFAGGGLAGLSLAYHMVRSPLRDARMLLIDRDDKTRNDRTLSFWTTRSTCFDQIVAREWTRFQFAGAGYESEIALGDYRYKLIRGIDLYQLVHRELSALPNVKFLQASVDRVEDGGETARVSAGGRTYSGRWVFDSRFDPQLFQPGSSKQACLWQYFKGWEIETAEPVFNPEAATLLDFRTPQKQSMRFFYVLPFSCRRALVEYVSLGRDEFDLALREYIERTLQIPDYRVVSREGGVNPLTDHIFPRREGGRIMNIGTRGGRIKPSTGYAFLRIQQDSRAIVQSLLANGHPFAVPSDSRRYRLYDGLMLEIMAHHGDQVKPIFTALFRNNPITRVLRFLDEQASPAENLLLIATLPPKLFLQALFQFRPIYLRDPDRSGFPSKPRDLSRRTNDQPS